jgi:hypothetical protein
MVLALADGGKKAEYLYKRLSADLFSDPRPRELFEAMQAYNDKHGPLSMSDMRLLPNINQLAGFEMLDGSTIWKPIKSKAGINAALEQLETQKITDDLNSMSKEFLKGMTEAVDNGSGRDVVEGHAAKLREALESLSVGSKELSKSEQIRELLDQRSFTGKLAYESIRGKLKISGKELTKIAKREEAKDEPQWRRERLPNGKFTRNLMLVKGLSMVSTMKLGTAKIDREHAAFLPSNLHKFIAPYSKSLDQHSFVLLGAPTDGRKSHTCQQVAVENARRGIKVVLVNTEADEIRVSMSLAAKISDCFIRDIDEANEVLNRWKYKKNLVIKQLRSQVDLLELLGYLETLKPGLVIIDYLATHFLGVDTPKQSSSPATIVQTLGTALVDNGIPVFCAVQGEIGKDGETSMPPTWMHRATLALIMRGRILKAGDEGAEEATCDRGTMAIRKNKHGGSSELIDLYWHPQTGAIENSLPLSWSDYNIRKAIEQKREDDKLKEAKEELETLRKSQQQRKERAKKNGRAEKAQEKLEDKGTARLPVEPWKPDTAELVARAAEELKNE